MTARRVDGRFSRRRLVVALAVTVPVGLATKAWAGVESGFVRANAGGALYVVFFTLVVAFIAPGVIPSIAAIRVFLATCAIEVSQLWHPPWLDPVRRSLPGRLVAGSTFDPWDFAGYALGAVAAVFVGRACLLRDGANDAPSRST